MISCFMPLIEQGSGVLELSRVSAESQAKSFARLQRLGSPIVDAVLDGALDGCRRKMGVPLGVVEPASLDRALGGAGKSHLEELKQKYTNKSVFAFQSDLIGNRWLRPDARFMSDGDRIKALGLRSNIFPTRTLSNRHSSDDSTKLCRRRHKAQEPTYILRVCEAFHEPRCSWHNFIAKAIRQLHSRHPDADISSERLLVADSGTRRRPDIVVDLKVKTFILDVAMASDARTDRLEVMCGHKRNKYFSPLSLFRERQPLKEVKVLGLAFDARGLICISTKRAAKEIGLKEGELAWLAARTLVGRLICLNRFSKEVVA
ncbi:hypothetical protein HPB49_003262 [Dermacentor silvarum]|uniref:Uncharacterized protein n=1 Tax=Dermacentor silvarum TaxID=543639 RepID=A0ACB8C0N2_DERSI|nr:hypothetical protein HPB49_003262 [Dermacentor silvarum]